MTEQIPDPQAQPLGPAAPPAVVDSAAAADSPVPTAPPTATVPAQAPAVPPGSPVGPPVPPPAPAYDPWAPPTQPPGPYPYAPGQQPPPPWGADLLATQRPPRKRPARATVLRWTAVAAVLLVTATAACLAVTAPQRTDLPGLATPNDGRYTFPALTLPQLPAGKPAPSAQGAGQRHYADLRALVLPAPLTGAKAAPATPANSAACADYAKLHDATANMPTLLATNACRAAATRTWTAKDGTRAEVWLLHFGSPAEAREFYDTLCADGSPVAVPNAVTAVDDFTLGPDQIAYTRTTSTAGSANQPAAKVAYLYAGDVVATVLMTNPQGVPSQAFHQVVTLQSDLLG
ncbi:hypothetical protein ACFW1A_12940 [Kitasatospora sp. NPDC058965]|uniref:hypothetical protein n=1 Tax=Kitasatospora sp. NPDC058965 TaxID=3346682 RepID=UPI0036ACB05E